MTKIAITSPWSFMSELSRVIFDWEKVKEIIIYWTPRQLIKVLKDWWITNEQLISDLIKRKTFWLNSISNEFKDPFYPEIWWEFRKNLWNIKFTLTCNPKEIRKAIIVMIWHSMDWISAEFERFDWEISTIKQLSPYINKDAIIVSWTKWASKAKIKLSKNSDETRNWAKTASEELLEKIGEKTILVLAWPTSSSSLAESINNPNKNKFFVTVAGNNSLAKQKFVDLLNPDMIDTYQSKEVKWTEFLWILKNIFAFLNWILEWYWLNDEQISLYQNWVRIIWERIFKQLWLKTKLINSPAWYPDFLLTCKKWRNWEWWRVIWKFFKEISWKNLSNDEIQLWIQTALEKYWKTVEWYQALSWMHQRLINEWVSSEYLILFRALDNILNWRRKFDIVYPVILKIIKAKPKKIKKGKESTASNQ